MGQLDYLRGSSSAQVQRFQEAVCFIRIRREWAEDSDDAFGSAGQHHDYVIHCQSPNVM
jgi:hypothetical protein